ncbi:MAG: hypothetical protein WCG87_04030 [Bacteroidota bacterium]
MRLHVGKFMDRAMLGMRGIVLLLLILLSTDAIAQQKKPLKKEVKIVSIYDVDTLKEPIPFKRQIFHDKIDKEQAKADAYDGKTDKIVGFGGDTIAARLLTQAILKDIDHLQIMVENLPPISIDPVAENQRKIRYLNAICSFVRKYNNDTKTDPVFYKKAVANFRGMILAHHELKLMAYVKNNVNIYSIFNNELLEGYPDVKSYLYTEMGKKEPVLMIRRLSEYATEPFAPEIVANAAPLVPNEVFNYATSSNRALSSAVRNSKDTLVQTIVLIADRSKSPLKALPFMGNIYRKKMTLAQVDSITGNRDLFFRSLVDLKLQNDSLGSASYSDELAYRSKNYIRDMNDLHESKDEVRFKCLEGMTPQQMYYLMVYGQDEIYTSSFLGTFKRMMDSMKNMHGNELLDTIHHDKFRTFIRMCAGYNTLRSFLNSMEEDKRSKLMSDFIAGLEKGKEDDLEDAVDVADAFGSIDDTALVSFLKQQVKLNYEQSYAKKSKKGVIVYGLLATLFQGADRSENDEAAMQQSEKLGLPPINMVPYKNLVKDSVVYEQFFFFGDEDGKSSYESFLSNFKENKGKWKISTDKYWSTITSTVGKKVVIFANLPLKEPEDEDAQNELCKHLSDTGIHPTIIVHRGHSYHLPITLDHLDEHTKIVVLGSCGGYHNLALVLDRSHDAHIISSKQVGTMSVNDPIVKAINDQLLVGNDVNWISIWKDLSNYFESKPAIRDKFNDYVPPHKNLGAIFIKAYRHLSSADATDK